MHWTNWAQRVTEIPGLRFPMPSLPGTMQRCCNSPASGAVIGSQDGTEFARRPYSGRAAPLIRLTREKLARIIAGPTCDRP